MLFNLTFQGVLAFALVGLASAHMKMSSPVPFDVASLDNSPLKPDGSDYPCKTCGYKISAMNKIPVNEPVLLSFDGSAIHGGGTCQIAISMDKEPTKDSTFKVVQTYEGDCPPAAGTGLTFNLPKDTPSGRLTLAWSWFNRVGNREMYMNLAPIEVTGGSDNEDYFQSLPDLFKANIPATECTTPETSDPTIPNPGDFLIRASTYKPGAVTGSCGAAGPEQNQNSQSSKVTNFAAYGPPAKDSNVIVPVDGSSGIGSGSGSGASSASGGNNGMYTQPAASPAQPSSAPTAGGNDGMYSSPAQPTSSAASSVAPSATAPSSAASTFSTHTVPASSAAPPAYPTLSPTIGQGVAGPSTGSSAPTGSPSSSSGSTSSGSTSSGSVSSAGQCTTEGAIVCNGSSQFGLCDHGSVVWQAVAVGTTCSNGAILKRSQPILPPLPRHHARGFHKARAL